MLDGWMYEERAFLEYGKCTEYYLSVFKFYWWVYKENECVKRFKNIQGNNTPWWDDKQTIIKIKIKTVFCKWKVLYTKLNLLYTLLYTVNCQNTLLFKKKNENF